MAAGNSIAVNRLHDMHNVGAGSRAMHDGFGHGVGEGSAGAGDQAAHGLPAQANREQDDNNQYDQRKRVGSVARKADYFHKHGKPRPRDGLNGARHGQVNRKVRDVPDQCEQHRESDRRRNHIALESQRAIVSRALWCNGLIDCLLCRFRRMIGCHDSIQTPKISSPVYPRSPIY
jgi:hypothetical protein